MRFLLIFVAGVISLLLLLTPAANAQFTQEFNDTVNSIRSTISYLSDQVNTLKDRLENTTQTISNKISDNVQAVETRIQTQFDIFVEDAKAIAYGFVLAICASFAGVFVGNICFELGIWYCRRRLKRAWNKNLAKARNATIAAVVGKNKVEPAPPTDNPATGLLQRKGWTS
jgi:predicted PurR-regulated permease PerM